MTNQEISNFTIFKCVSCNKKFVSKTNLNKHFTTKSHEITLLKARQIENIDDTAKYVTISLKNKQGKIIAKTIVDAHIYLLINQYSFHLDDGYAKICINGQQIRLHIYIYENFSGKKRTPNKIIDHRNRDRLDNTLQNLRELTYSTNNMNKNKKINATSKFYGVSKDRQYYVCKIMNYQFKYKDELHAAYHYNLLVKKLNLEDIKELNDISKPTDFIIKEKIPKKNNLPIGIFVTEKMFYYTYKGKYYPGFKTLEEAVMARQTAIEQFKSEKKNKILNEQILVNDNCIPIIGIFNKKGNYLCETIVDENLYYDLKQYPMRFSKGYILITVHGKTWGLSRFIMNCTDSNLRVDHIYSNTLDNQKENLRIVSVQANNENKSSTKKSTSKYVGVCYDKRCKKGWEAYITVNRKRKYLGKFETEQEAVNIRDIEAKKLNQEGHNFKINKL